MADAREALAALRESRDDGRIWHDGGRTITRLAREAVVRVQYVHVDLRTLTTELRTVNGGGE